MSELTAGQIRVSRDCLLVTIDKLNDLLLDKGDELKADQIKQISRAIRQLNNGVAELTAKAIEGTERELSRAVEGIKNATDKANKALDTLDEIKDVINIVTALVGLGIAVTTGNPGGILATVKGVASAAGRTVKKGRKTKTVKLMKKVRQKNRIK